MQKSLNALVQPTVSLLSIRWKSDKVEDCCAPQIEEATHKHIHPGNGFVPELLRHTEVSQKYFKGNSEARVLT